MPDDQKLVSSALVIGAGIAGCSAAIMLAERGVDVTLIEKQTEWRFASSGIFVYSNGLVSLDAVGVLDEVLAAGFAIEDGRNPYVDQHGDPIATTVYPSAGSGFPPIVGIKRAELHRVLAGRLAQVSVEARLGTTVAHLDPGTARTPATAVLSDDTVGEYDLVLAAEGIRSPARELVHPGLSPSPTGFAIWRSVHDRPAGLDAKIMAMGLGKRIGIMPISTDKLYTFGTVVEPTKRWFPPEEWPATMRATFAEFDGPIRRFLDEISDDSEVLFTAVEEVAAPLPWHSGRLLLIGDAAHASTPFMGQGGAMAVEDAVVLASMLDAGKHDSVPDLSGAFAQRRLPVCRFVQEVSRAVGRAGAVENEESVLRRNTEMPATAQRQVDEFYARLSALQADPVATAG